MRRLPIPQRRVCAASHTPVTKQQLRRRWISGERDYEKDWKELLLAGIKY
jgi:hypothetical protein